MEKIILIFIDGIGIGEKNSIRNPILNLFTDISLGLLLCEDSFPAFFPGGTALAIDACLAVPGIPQSVTGQIMQERGVDIPVISPQQAADRHCGLRNAEDFQTGDP
ncbi:MAG: hypothetical protein B6241_09205 [Spirochaetaceae bacterium 4572_59]|nr:MAG: hypothetical protein B6241_09205 [Spirochaetaceae bacterium 4572_59]